jgi:hypothetical protein
VAGALMFYSLCGPVERKKPLTWEAQVQPCREAFFFWKALHAGGPSFDRFYLFLGIE